MSASLELISKVWENEMEYSLQQERLWEPNSIKV